jgi:hypothetical protein
MVDRRPGREDHRVCDTEYGILCHRLCRLRSDAEFRDEVAQLVAHLAEFMAAAQSVVRGGGDAGDDLAGWLLR